MQRLAGGCFWCLEAVYDELKGVEDVVSGYAGGAKPNPSYEQVCTGTTGHAEVVQITFDNEVVSFRQLLDVFFTIHDPTTLNRQGADVGTQYRSAIFYHSPEQKATAELRSRELRRIICGTTRLSPRWCRWTRFIRRKTIIRNTSAITRIRVTAGW